MTEQSCQGRTAESAPGSNPQYGFKITDCSKYCGPTGSAVNGPTLSFSSFRQSLTSNVNYLKRRFSSGDLSSECDDTEAPVDPYTRKTPPVTSQPQAPPPPPPPASQGSSSVSSGIGSTATSGSASGSDLSLNLRSGSKTTSAPSSPAKSRESLLQRVQSLTGQARDQGASILVLLLK
ncbi:synapsin-like [Harmonia axyridis]|uniref:synapsin-like n=1 Tax=Harmonia axyridis TaxID=115357 RepID=UPI001E275DC9|nr:synapsin-like [Harmonia axyridis]